MNKKDRGILYGMSFGDGGIYITKDQSTHTARMVIGHSPKQLEYLEYKNNLLHSIFGGRKTKINIYKSLNKTTNKIYTNTQICRTEKYFRQMHRVLYKSGVKKYTRQSLDYLTDHGLAIWYMDDGCGTIHRNKEGKPTSCATRIATYCIPEEAEIIRDWFLEVYNINVKFDVDKRNGKVSIRMNTSESKKFVQIVSPYIIESMKYKINHVDCDTRDQCPLVSGEDIV